MKMTRGLNLTFHLVVTVAAMLTASATDAAAQFSGPNTTSLSPIPYEFTGNWGWGVGRFDCGSTRDSFGRPTIVGDGKIEGSIKNNGGNPNLCQWPIAELEKSMNGRGRMWMKTFASDDAMSPKWSCAISFGEAITAGGRTFSQRADSFVMWHQSPQWARVIYTDGRKHPPATDLFYWGHSIGSMEGKTFVVETTNFTWDTDGYDDQSHMARSHLAKWIERYTVKDADTLEVVYIVEDPVFLKEKFTWTAKLVKATAPFLNQYDCDTESQEREIYSTFKNPYPDDNTAERFFGIK